VIVKLYLHNQVNVKYSNTSYMSREEKGEKRMKLKEFIILALLFGLAIVKFPVAKAPTIDLAITSVEYTGTEYSWITGTLLSVTVHLEVFIENVGAETIDEIELYYGSTLVHESALSAYLNNPGMLWSGPPLSSYTRIDHPIGYFPHLILPPGENRTYYPIISYIDEFSDGQSEYAVGTWYAFHYICFNDDNYYNHLPWWASTPQDGTVGLPPVTPSSVGGIVAPVDKLGLLAPYIGLASTIIAGTIATAIYVKSVRHQKK